MTCKPHRGADFSTVGKNHFGRQHCNPSSLPALSISAESFTHDTGGEYELVPAGDDGWTIRALRYGDEVRATMCREFPRPLAIATRLSFAFLETSSPYTHTPNPLRRQPAQRIPSRSSSARLSTPASARRPRPSPSTSPSSASPIAPAPSPPPPPPPPPT